MTRKKITLMVLMASNVSAEFQVWVHVFGWREYARKRRTCKLPHIKPATFLQLLVFHSWLVSSLLSTILFCLSCSSLVGSRGHRPTASTNHVPLNTCQIATSYPSSSIQTWSDHQVIANLSVTPEKPHYILYIEETTTGWKQNKNDML